MTLCIIQCRMGSQRFKGKSLAMLNGLPLIQHVINRALQMPVDQVCVAIPDTPEDSALAAWLRYGKGQKYSWMQITNVAPDDVLGRFAAVISMFPEADPIVRLTGDCPLIDARIAGDVLALYRQTAGCEYAWNVAPGYIDGTDVEVCSRAALLRAHAEVLFADDREHVTPWIRRNYKVATLYPPRDQSGLKLSVDTPEDLAFVAEYCRAFAV